MILPKLLPSLLRRGLQDDVTDTSLDHPHVVRRSENGDHPAWKAKP